MFSRIEPSSFRFNLNGILNDHDINPDFIIEKYHTVQIVHPRFSNGHLGKRNTRSCFRRSHRNVTSCMDLKDGRDFMGIAVEDAMDMDNII